MEIGNFATKPNLNLAQPRTSSSAEQPVNAFGIGPANRPEVELSPQARILQQNEQVQNERRSMLNQTRAADQEQPEQQINRDYVRVSSSVGSAASNNLSNEKATEIYQSIQELL